MSNKNKNGREESFEKHYLPALQEPRTYSHSTENIKHLETHASHIFLAGEFAYKIKKSVNYGFLDYSSLEKRKRFCTREFEINKRFAPSLYIEVVEIYWDGNSINFNGDGIIIEYALKMRRFADNALLSTMLKDNQLNSKILEQLILGIIKAHLSAPLTPDRSSLEDVRSLMLDNIDKIKSSSQGFISSEELNSACCLIEDAVNQSSKLITQRQKTHVRQLHGDLHLGNCCLFEGKAFAFDGIEFDDKYSCIDPWSDIAFLLMDLDYFDRPDLFAEALYYYLYFDDDYQGLPLLPIYLSYRAAVRAKVACLHPNAAEKKFEIRRHFDLALNYLKPEESIIIAVGGLSGSGKTTISRLLSARVKGIVIRSDVVRKHLAGISPEEKAPENVYSEKFNKKTIQGMLKRAECSIKTGMPIILDATWLGADWRKELETFSKKTGLKTFKFWCSASAEVLKERISKRVSDASDADLKVLEQQLELEVDASDWETINSEQSSEDSVEQIRKLIANG